LHDFWGNPLPPRDLTKGQYRGGRRPIDLFRRIHAGIKGTPMPAFGGTVLKDEDIWDVVNYVMSIPFESSPTTPSKPEMVAKTAQVGRSTP
jgi:mono/diheme cytochrome c family protein